MKTGLIGGSVLALVASTVAVIGGGAPAAATVSYESPPSVQIGWTDAAAPDQAHDASGSANLPIGTWTDDAGVTHTTRVYATYDLSAFAGREVYGGTLRVQEKGVGDCADQATELWRTTAVDATPTWADAPAETGLLGSADTGATCPAAYTYDVSDALADATADGEQSITFEIRVRVDVEADPGYFRSVYWFDGLTFSMEYDTAPAVDDEVLVNGGFACAQQAPYPTIWSTLLQARVLDADGDRLSTDYAVWPIGDPEARTTYTATNTASGRIGAVTVPGTDLVSGGTYAWQARANDGTENSAWSPVCHFTWDDAEPSAPTVTSLTYPTSADVTAPVGELAGFTLSGEGDPDVAGFAYSWTGTGGSACAYSGEYGQLVCPDPFGYAGRVRADVPGGTATVRLTPEGSRFYVRSVDAAGNVSAEVTTVIVVPDSDPTITVTNGDPRWNEPIEVRLAPAAGVTGVTEYEVKADDGGTETIPAEADGTAAYRWTTTSTTWTHLRVRSHSASGFVSTEASYDHYLDIATGPGVTSDVYLPQEQGSFGGAGVPGTFTFTPPLGWTEVDSYEYSFDIIDTPVSVPAGADGTATITWTPDHAGYYGVDVYATRADGGVEHTYYEFSVAE
ncbi:hypothetical protein [Actinoplanes sp. NPDC051851]|uniref:hypothetical protein n=1 Tax=Actinoplanes sp. NPDC051851 TaxID=3154753 RepID=UPI003429E0DC